MQKKLNKKEFIYFNVMLKTLNLIEDSQWCVKKDTNCTNNNFYSVTVGSVLIINEEEIHSIEVEEGMFNLINIIQEDKFKDFIKMRIIILFDNIKDNISIKTLNQISERFKKYWNEANQRFKEQS